VKPPLTQGAPAGEEIADGVYQNCGDYVL